MLRTFTTIAALGFTVAFSAFGASPAQAAACFGNLGTCYAVAGSAQAANSPGSFGSFNYLDGATQGALDFSTSNNRGISRVDLSTGRIELYADSNDGGTSSGGAHGSWLETVKFDLPDGVLSVEIPVHARLRGNNTHRDGATYNNIAMNFQIASYGNSAHSSATSYSKVCGVDDDFTDTVCRDGVVGLTYTSSITVWEDVYYGISMYAMVGGRNIIQDFLGGLEFAWTLPTGVTYSSGSGVFLEGISPVEAPEPASVALVGLGIAGLIARRRVPKRAG